jgi:hypothetical protein
MYGRVNGSAYFLYKIYGEKLENKQGRINCVTQERTIMTGEGFITLIEGKGMEEGQIAKKVLQPKELAASMIS